MQFGATVHYIFETSTIYQDNFKMSYNIRTSNIIYYSA